MSLDLAVLGMQVDTSDVKTGGADLDTFSKKAANANKAADKVSKSSSKMGTSVRRSGNGLRMASMQLSQVAQQGAVTGNYLQALMVQIPDLALGFGAAGIVAGALVPVLYGVGKGLLGVRDDAKAFDDATKSLSQTLSDYRGYAMLAATDTLTLREQFGDFAEEVKGFSEYMAVVSLGGVMDALKNTVEPLKSDIQGVLDIVQSIERAKKRLAADQAKYDIGLVGPEYILRSKEAIELLSYEAISAAEKLGLTVDQVKVLGSELSDLSSATGMDDMRSQAAEALSTFQDMFPAGEKLPEPFRKVVAQLEDMVRTAAETETAIYGAADAGKFLSETDMGAGIRSARNDAIDLMTVLTAAQAAMQRQSDANLDRGSLQSQYAMYGAGQKTMREGSIEASYAPDGGWGNLYKTPPKSKGSRGGGGGGGSLSWLEQYERDVSGINARTEALKGALAAGADFEHQLAVIEEEQSLLNAAQRAGVNLTPEVKESIRGMAEDYVAAEAAMQSVIDQNEKMNETFKAGEDILDSLFDAGLQGFDSLKDAVISLVAEMAKMELINSFTSSSFGGGITSALGGLFGGIPAFATGTNNHKGGLARVNEQGGEIMNLPSGTQVIPHDVSMAMARNAGGAQVSEVRITLGDDLKAEIIGSAVGISVQASGQQIQNNNRRMAETSRRQG